MSEFIVKAFLLGQVAFWPLLILAITWVFIHFLRKVW